MDTTDARTVARWSSVAAAVIGLVAGVVIGWLLFRDGAGSGGGTGAGEGAEAADDARWACEIVESYPADFSAEQDLFDAPEDHQRLVAAMELAMAAGRADERYTDLHDVSRDLLMAVRGVDMTGIDSAFLELQDACGAL